MKTNESGRSMIEMLGVLAIIGVLSVGGIAGYSKAMSVHKVNKTIDQLTQITTSTRALFSGHKTFAALSGSNAGNLIYKSHLVPDEMVTSFSNGAITMENAFGGAVTLAAAKKGNTDNKAFSVTYTIIPQEPCLELVTKDWGHGRSSGLYSIKINNKVVYKVDSNTAADKDPINISKALTNCNNPYNNTIEWVFY